MDLRMRNVVIDCNDMARMEAFWSGLTGFVKRWENDIYRVLAHPDGRRPGLILQKVPETSSEKNRVHFDLDSPDLEAAVSHAEDLGATRVRRVQEEVEWIVMQDPEGNFFCLQSRGDS